MEENNKRPDFEQPSREIETFVGGTPRKTLLQKGFYSAISYSPMMHRHYYEEIHLFHGGSARLVLGDRVIEMHSGDAVIVPRSAYHNIVDYDENVSHSAFQIDLPEADFNTARLSAGLISDFFALLSSVEASSDHAALCPYISFFAEQLTRSEVVVPRRVSDYAFIVNEFFSMNYASDIHINDLAKILRVSDKQAARLVLKHTGRTFIEELTQTRMQAAEQLMRRSPSMALSKIAAAVGYQSYPGFWKAYKRYKEGS